MRFTRLLFRILVICGPILGLAHQAHADRFETTSQWIAVVAPALGDALNPLCELRREQGLHVVVIDEPGMTANAARLQKRLHVLQRRWKGPTYILLAGSVVREGVQDARQFVVPALQGTVTRMKGRPSDNGYGCVDDSRVPTAAVGRFPARTVEEAAGMVAKTLAWERQRTAGPWKRRMTVLAGAPSFGPLVDALVERLAMSQLDKVPADWSARAVYHNPNSPFVLPDADMVPRTLAYLSEGQSLIAYMGHSWLDGFWDGQARFDRQEWRSIELDHAGGIFATFGCHACEYDPDHGDGYGLVAMRNPRGPVAVLGASGIDWAAMAMLFSEGLLDNLPAAGEAPRLGEVWLRMKRHLAEGPINPVIYRALDRVDGDPDTPQAVQRLEHLEMFTLLGDPAIRFPAMPARIELDVDGEARPGGTLKISGRVPVELAGASGTFTIERTHTSRPIGLEPLPPANKPDERDRAMRANHERSNRFVILETPAAVANESFSVELRLPEEIPWPRIVVRAYWATDAHDGMAVRVLSLKSATADENQAESKKN